MTVFFNQLKKINISHNASDFYIIDEDDNVELRLGNTFLLFTWPGRRALEADPWKEMIVSSSNQIYLTSLSVLHLNNHFCDLYLAVLQFSHMALRT